MRNRIINLDVVAEIAQALGDLNESVIFVGGAVISIYADDPAADKVRPTQDVDLTLKLLGVNQLPQIHAKEIFGPSENRVTG